MKEYAKKPEPSSRTIQSNTKAFRQASISEVLQAYKDRIEGKPVQRQSVNEEELLQAKAAQQDYIKSVLQQYKERNIQRYAPEEDEELIQGKFDTAQREEIDEDELLQGKFESDTQTEQEPVQREVKPNNTGLPDNLKTGIENLSGYSMDDVKVHYNSDKPAQLNALAYAQGTDIHVAPGQEQHLPHEAWHVVQQKQGRVQPTMQLQGVNVNDNEGLEREADVMGEKCIQPKKQNLIPKNHQSPCDSIVQRLTIKLADGTYRRFRKVAEDYIELQQPTRKSEPLDSKLAVLKEVADEIKKYNSDVYDYGPHVAVSVINKKMFIALNTSYKCPSEKLLPSESSLFAATFYALKEMKKRYDIGHQLDKLQIEDDHKYAVYWATNIKDVFVFTAKKMDEGVIHGEQRIMNYIINNKSLFKERKPSEFERVIHIGGTKTDCHKCVGAHDERDPDLHDIFKSQLLSPRDEQEFVIDKKTKKKKKKKTNSFTDYPNWTSPTTEEPLRANEEDIYWREWALSDDMSQEEMAKFYEYLTKPRH